MKLKKNTLFVICLVCGFGSFQAVGQTSDPKPKTTEVEPAPLKKVDAPAEYPGGNGTMKKFIAENLKYPESALKLGIEGKCHLLLKISETGEITDVIVKRGVTDCPECDKEAVRVIKSMPKWIPSLSADGKNIPSTFMLPVSFKL
jgi:protein TonB